ncbi:tRNA pseudouridine synthase A-like isoform X2 [Argopecten irradians]|uniref:tRNA pseudouridine synthase A-like isoform X2 n=1 Tax=Argopecten irradians TaxID=31199 RepID=UPI00371860C9
MCYRSTLENGRIFQPPDLEKVARDINRRLYLQRESIRVLNIEQVPRTFHCRFAALTRSYVYRLAIASEDGNTFYERAFKERSEIQWVCCPKFDTRKFIKAAEMFSGRNQFEFYRQADKKNQFIGPTKRSVIVHIRRGISQSNDLCIGSGEFWDIHITGTSFMRKQVRKMVGCMVNIAKGLTTLEGLHQKLDGKGELDDRDIIGPDGLFLKSTTFRKEAVNFADDDQLLDKSDVFYGPHSKDISKHSSLECCGSTCGSTEDTNRINLHSIHGDHVQSSNIIHHNSNKQYQLSSEQSINRLVGKEVTN